MQLSAIGFVAVHAQDQDPGVRDAPRDLPRGLDPVQPAHGDIHDDDVGRLLQRAANGLRAVARLGDDLPSGMFLQHFAQPLPHQRVIVSQQES
jgi:hypothetical protein